MKQNELTALIHNFNTDCHKQYTKVSNYLGNRLDESLKEIEKFYYSDFWLNRFKKRIYDEDECYIPIQLDIILGVTSDLRETAKFKLYNEDQNSNGISSKNIISLNTNMSKEKLNDSHINNVIMHEFGHMLYNQKGFKLIVELNKRVIKSPGLFIKNNEVLEREDYKYFIDHNELRLRIVPIIKEMYDNNWTSEDVYNLSENLEMDDIKDIFTKEYILELIDNLL